MAADSVAEPSEVNVVPSELEETVTVDHDANDGSTTVTTQRHLPSDAPALAPGPLVTTTGEVIGEHEGFARYTVGQRRGLPGGFGEPIYVVAIRPETREVVVGSGAQRQFRGLEVGKQIRLGSELWTVAGVFHTGDAMDSEVWGDADIVAATYRRGSTRTSTPTCSFKRETISAPRAVVSTARSLSAAPAPDTPASAGIAGSRDSCDPARTMKCSP